jgi:hypothetical protein
MRGEPTSNIEHGFCQCNARIFYVEVVGTMPDSPTYKLQVKIEGRVAPGPPRVPTALTPAFWLRALCVPWL